MTRLLSITLLLLCVAASPAFPELRVRPVGQAPTTLPALSKAPLTDVAAWEKRRDEIRREWDEIIGPMPARVPLETTIVSTESLDDHTRLLVRYRVDAKTTNEAYVLVPKGAAGKLPGVVALHPTSKTNLRDPVGLANRESVHHALHLARRGYVVVAPRNFLWSGEPDETWQQAAERVTRREGWQTGMARMLWDAMRAVDVLLERPDVDATRIGAIGHSLGGKEALYLAAFDERIVAAISCEGGVGLPMSNWEADWYLGPQIKSPTFRHDNHEVMALAAPRSLLVIGGGKTDGPHSWPYVEASLPVWRLYGAEERLGLLLHDQGHNFPKPGPDRERAYGWLDHWLKLPLP
jgi:dienelactone hydrolase